MFIAASTSLVAVWAMYRSKIIRSVGVSISTPSAKAVSRAGSTAVCVSCASAVPTVRSCSCRRVFSPTTLVIPSRKSSVMI